MVESNINSDYLFFKNHGNFHQNEHPCCTMVKIRQKIERVGQEL